MKRSLATTLGVVTAILLPLAGCGGGSGSEASSDQVTLTLASWTVNITAEFKALSEGFHAANPNVTVQLKEYDAKNYDTQMLADLATGRAPDAYVQKNLMNFYTYQSNSQLLDVSDVAKGLGSKVGGLANYSVNGKTYGIPYRQDSWVLFYNKALFDKAGVAYPDGSWTWDDYATISKQVTAKLKAAGSDALGTHQHPWQSTVQGFALAQTPNASLESGEFSYLKPYYERALDLQNSGAQVKFGEATTKNLTYQAQFGKQHAAMMPMGTWYMATLLAQQANGNADTFQWGMAPAPQFTSDTAGRSKTPVTFGDPTAFGINPAISKKKIAVAKAFLAYAAGDKGAKSLVDIGITPANTAVAAATWFDLKGIPTDDLSKFAFSTHDTRPENPVSKHTANLQAILGELHTSVLSGGKDIDTALSDAQNRAKTTILNK